MSKRRKKRDTHLSPLGWRAWLIIYHTKRMAPGVTLGKEFVQGKREKPWTKAQLKRKILKEFSRDEVLGVYAKHCVRVNIVGSTARARKLLNTDRREPN